MSSSFSPTPAELTLVSQLFFKADPQNQGFITTDIAVRLSGGAKISPVTIGEIFNIADEGNTGRLSRKDIAVLVRLIGWAQKGEKITRALLNTPGPLAVIEGVNVLGSQNTGLSLPKSPPPTFPPLTPQDRTKFQSLFLKAGAVNGLLTGDKARDLFLKSKLSNEQLMLIWNLADTQDRGYLDVIDFAIGMYFIQGAMSGSLTFIPNTLPPGLYQQAGGITPSSTSIQPQVANGSGSFSPIRTTFVPPSTATATNQSVLVPQSTGFNIATAKVAPALPARPSANFQQTNGYASSDWDVTQAEKASADQYFDTLDTQRRGYIEGDAAVPFMLKSRLPGEILAQIWDLADINHDGRLTREGFAIAVHLIQKKIAGHDVPFVLPPSLIPPFLRSSMLGQSPFSPRNVTTQPEQVEDLLELDDTPPQSATHPLTLKPQITGPLAPSKQGFSAPLFKDPFSLPSPTPDIFDNSSSPPFPDQSAEIGNIQNQLSSTQKSASAAKDERQALEQTLSDQAVQLSTLQTQLSSAKASYETEISLLSTLKDRRSGQLAEIQKAREEIIRAESDLSAIRVEKTEIEGVFLRDKEEARELHRRMLETGQQAEALKAVVEKLRKEAKQQRGLLAIARKQLSTKEAEKAKVDKQHAEAIAEVTALNEETNASIDSSPAPKARMSSLSSSDSLTFAASQPLPATPDLSQSLRSTNNPFERLARGSGPSTPRPQSPFLEFQNVLASPILNGTNSLDVGFDASAADTERKLTSSTEHTSNDSETVVYVSERTASPTSNENFVTPPTSAIGTATSNSTSSAAMKYPALGLTSSIQKPSSPPGAPESFGEVTDLSSKLKELEDSEDESEEEDFITSEPLGDGRTDTLIAPPISDNGDVSLTNNNDKSVKQDLGGSSTNLFDAIFETSVPQPLPQDPDNTPLDISSTDKPKASLHEKSKEATSQIAGVDVFDSTLNDIRAASSSTTQPVMDFFADSFGDDFDFEAAKVEFPTVPADLASQGQPTGSTFDNIFGTSGPSTKSIPTLPHQDKIDTTFKDIFDTIDPKPSDVVDKTNETQAVAASSSSPVPSHEGSMPGGFPSHPASPITSITSAEREKDLRSSPSRVGSPKPRIISPTKETMDKSKEGPHRHRLSIKLPFRKRKQPAPAPSSPLPEVPVKEPQRARAGNDVEPVKQLLSMGFDREQAVEALEKYDYNVQRALNDLLAR